MADFMSFDLSLEQRFEVERIRQEVQQMNRDQALDLLLEASKTLMIKDNLIRDLMRKAEL
jgi:hypothetical protein